MVTGQAVSRPRTDEQGAGETTHIHIQPDHTGARAQGPTHAKAHAPSAGFPCGRKHAAGQGGATPSKSGIIDWHRVGLGPRK